jgi:hypothetical protein
MNLTKTIHVTPHPNGGWQVKKGGSSKASSIHSTKKDAEDSSRATARREKLELFIHKLDGQIQRRDSYGNDPYPPKC